MQLPSQASQSAPCKISLSGYPALRHFGLRLYPYVSATPNNWSKVTLAIAAVWASSECKGAPVAPGAAEIAVQHLESDAEQGFKPSHGVLKTLVRAAQVARVSGLHNALAQTQCLQSFSGSWMARLVRLTRKT